VVPFPLVPHGAFVLFGVAFSRAAAAAPDGFGAPDMPFLHARRPVADVVVRAREGALGLDEAAAEAMRR